MQRTNGNFSKSVECSPFTRTTQDSEDDEVVDSPPIFCYEQTRDVYRVLRPALDFNARICIDYNSSPKYQSAPSLMEVTDWTGCKFYVPESVDEDPSPIPYDIMLRVPWRNPPVSLWQLMTFIKMHKQHIGHLFTPEIRAFLCLKCLDLVIHLFQVGITDRDLHATSFVFNGTKLELIDKNWEIREREIPPECLIGGSLNPEQMTVHRFAVLCYNILALDDPFQIIDEYKKVKYQTTSLDEQLYRINAYTGALSVFLVNKSALQIHGDVSYLLARMLAWIPSFRPGLL